MGENDSSHEKSTGLPDEMKIGEQNWDPWN